MSAPNQLHEAMTTACHEVGILPPDALPVFGKWIDADIDGDPHGKGDGRVKLFLDGEGGIACNWKTSEKEVFFAGDTASLTPEEKAVRHQSREAARIRAQVELDEAHDQAAQNASAIYADASKEISSHPYAAKKNVNFGSRVRRGDWAQRGWPDALLIPIYNSGGELTTLEAINVDGEKDFLKGGKKKGCFHPFGKIRGAERVLIGEGVANVAPAVESTGLPAAAAMDSGNLLHVAKEIRRIEPDAEIIFLADNDIKVGGSNPGLTAATAAALAIGGKVAVPQMGKACDFWDVWNERGAEAIKQAVANASAPDKEIHQPEPANAPGDDSGWPEPQPLAAKVIPEPYPIDALPKTIRAAVEEVAGFVKAPVPMVASSALAALSLAIQAHTDAKRAEKLHGPVGLFLLTIADSGERKSTCDGFFTKAIRDYEEAQAEAAKPILIDHKAAIDAWEAKRGGVKEKIRQLAKDNKSTAGMESDLRDLEHDKPESLRIPRLLYADATPEALAYGLAKHWPSGGVVSAEGGIVFGSHGMGKESVMRNLALLNQLWDGTSLTIDRRTSESFTVRGARLTIALQIQEATLRSFFDKTGALARGTGFLARFLVAWPESTQGFRPFTEPPDNWPHLAAFNRRIAAILDQPAPIDDDGALTPALLTLAPDAKTAWVNFHDAIESELASGGELYDVRDVASKSADNATRLAVLFQIFEHGMDGAVGLDCFESASRIAAWHLNEARRFFGELALPAELADAARLDRWLIEYCKRERTHLAPTREAQRLGPIRDKERLTTALLELEELDRVRVTQEGRRKTIKVNPALLGVAP